MTESREKLICVATNRAMSVIQNINLGNIIAEQGSTVLLEKKASLGMAALFINEATLGTFLPPIAEKINEYIAENGRALVEEAITNELDLYANKPLHNLLKHIGEEQIRAIITATYERLILGIGTHFTEIFDIGGVVESKVNAMTPKELEVLVLAIMKRELSAIVDLGAVIGFILGLFTLITK